MKTPSLDELRTQARRTYRYWPLYLMVRLREVEQYLTPAQRDELGAVLGETVGTLPAPTAAWDTTLLIEYGLLQGDEPLPTAPPPALARWLDGESIGFQVNDRGVLVFVVQTPTTQATLQLLQTTPEHQATLHTVAMIFNQMALELTPQTALQTAQLWAAFQGARSLGWQMTTSPMQSVVLSPAPALPPRRRGRGFFRTPTS